MSTKYYQTLLPNLAGESGESGSRESATQHPNHDPHQSRWRTKRPAFLCLYIYCVSVCKLYRVIRSTRTVLQRAASAGRVGLLVVSKSPQDREREPELPTSRGPKRKAQQVRKGRRGSQQVAPSNAVNGKHEKKIKKNQKIDDGQVLAAPPEKRKSPRAN